MGQNKSLYEVLMSYTTLRKRDSWANLGSAEITIDSRAFIKDMIYLVNMPTPVNPGDPPGSALDGYLLLCTDTLTASSAPGFNHVTIIDSAAGYISFDANIISPHFRIIATVTDLTAIENDPYDPAFVPFAETDDTQVKIDEDELETILLEAGVPFVTLEELEYPREKILELMVKPAMKQYFKYFPLVKVQTYPVNTIAQTNGQFEIEFPTWSYGVVRAFLNQGMPGNVNSHYWGYFFNELAGYSRYGGIGGMGTSSKGSKPYFSNSEGQSTFMLQRAASQGILNYYTRIYTRIKRTEDGKRYVTGHINKFGTIELHFGYYCWNWDVIDHNRRDEVRKLATAHVLRALGSLRGLVKTDIPGTLNYERMLTRADALEKEVLDLWKAFTKVVVIRGEG